MSIYSTVESGTSFHRSRFSKSISYTKKYDCQFSQIIPVLEKFVLPGDVWRISGDVLVRFQPQLAPSLTPSTFRVRYFFVPLRLLDENSELIITGSKDGHLYSGTLPVFKNIFDDADKVQHSDCYKIQKHSLMDYFGCQIGDYENIKTAEFLPAAYWPKGYFRILWDYYFDENVSYAHSTYSDFEDYWNNNRKAYGGMLNPQSVYLPKDYFTSALPWQLKGIAPTISMSGTGTFTPNYNASWANVNSDGDTNSPVHFDHINGQTQPFIYNQGSSESSSSAYAKVADTNSRINNNLNTPQTVSFAAGSFNADEFRTMMAQTRIFERLARCGSRYTEYLRSNFGVAPADDTLQRAQYLGGWKLPIITTEVLQTAEDGSTPVGTMRGHGITRGGNQIQNFHAKEFGILLGLAHIIPNVEYTTGCPRELSYKKRFDFFNPSLQHLSEQEVRNGELFVDFNGTDNDDTFGFQAYANELRSSTDKTVGELRDTLSYWTQSISFSSRPNLNSAFLLGSNYNANFNQNFAVSGATAYPCVVQFRNNLDVYRPMVRYATPGLVDHY